MEKMWKKLIEGLRRQQKKQEKEPIKWSEIGLSKIIIMILAGIFLLILSMPSAGLFGKVDSTRNGTDQKNVQEKAQDTAADAMEAYAGKQEQQLQKLLSKVEGIGKVEVMVTIASSEEKKALQQEDISNSSTNETDSAGGTRSQATRHPQPDLRQHEAGTGACGGGWEGTVYCTDPVSAGRGSAGGGTGGGNRRDRFGNNCSCRGIISYRGT